MLKRNIKNILNKMKINEQISFFARDYSGYRQDIVVKKNNCFMLFSRGHNWEDQLFECFDEKKILKIIWKLKPHSCFLESEV